MSNWTPYLVRTAPYPAKSTSVFLGKRQECSVTNCDDPGVERSKKVLKVHWTLRGTSLAVPPFVTLRDIPRSQEAVVSKADPAPAAMPIFFDSSVSSWPAGFRGPVPDRHLLF